METYLKPPNPDYHKKQFSIRDNEKIKAHKNAGKACSTCTYFCIAPSPVSKCKLKAGKQVKSYNICQYHIDAIFAAT